MRRRAPPRLRRQSGSARPPQEDGASKRWGTLPISSGASQPSHSSRADGEALARAWPSLSSSLRSRPVAPRARLSSQADGVAQEPLERSPRQRPGPHSLRPSNQPSRCLPGAPKRKRKALPGECPPGRLSPRAHLLPRVPAGIMSHPVAQSRLGRASSQQGHKTHGVRPLLRAVTPHLGVCHSSHSRLLAQQRCRPGVRAGQQDNLLPPIPGPRRRPKARLPLSPGARDCSLRKALA